MDSDRDTNNNAAIMEKSYSLRPRAVSRKEDEEVEQEDFWKPRGKPRRKSKQKSLPLSKYRRKTANARERFRMREINEAFEALRRAIPHLSSNCESPNEKLTKISTLRLAMKYITALDQALRDSDPDSDGEWTPLTTPSDLRESSTPSSVSDHPDLYDHFFSSSSSESSISLSSPYNLSSIMASPSPNFSSGLPCTSEHHHSKRFPSTDVRSSSESRSSGVTGTIVLEEDLPQPFITTGDFHSFTPALLEELEDISSPLVDLDQFLLT